MVDGTIDYGKIASWIQRDPTIVRRCSKLFIHRTTIASVVVLERYLMWADPVNIHV